MIERFLREIVASLPLTITRSSWDGTSMLLGGQDWSFSSLSAWRLVKDGVLLCACYDDLAPNVFAELSGAQIVRVTAQSDETPVDPVFHLSTGVAMEVFSTDTYEPWVLRLPDGSVWVAAPGEKDAFS